MLNLEFSKLDFSFPFEQFPINFDLPQPILIQTSTATQPNITIHQISPQTTTPLAQIKLNKTLQ